MNIAPITTAQAGSKAGTLSELTTKEVKHTEQVHSTDPIDLTGKELTEIGTDSPVAQLQRGVVRLRVELNGETIGVGSGIVISKDGLILSVNHVPAIGKSAGSKPFDFLPGTGVLQNLRSWGELLNQKGDVKLLADFPLLPKPKPPVTIFSPAPDILASEPPDFSKATFASKAATAYSRSDNTIELLTLPVQIITESPGEDLMLARIAMSEQSDPYPFVKITDVVPGKGSFVYSVGHPLGIGHNALALGEVLDSSFDVKKIEGAIKAHGVILNGIGNAFGGKGTGGNFLSKLAQSLAVSCAGIDVGPLVKFINGAIVSTNRIDHGSSGGLLCNPDGEAVGVTYLGFGLPFNSTPLLKYAAGTLGLNANQLPLSAVTGSVGMKKAIPFLETVGVNISRIRDGEPSGIERVEERAAKNRARVAMAELLRKQNVPGDKISKRLRELGLEENEPVQSELAETSNKPVEDTVVASSGDSGSSASTSGKYFIKSGDQKFSCDSKPVRVAKLSADIDSSDSAIPAVVVLNIDIETESGQPFKIENLRVGPKGFDFNHDIDPETRRVIVEHLDVDQDLAQRLAELDRRVKEINSRRTTNPET